MRKDSENYFGYRFNSRNKSNLTEISSPVLLPKLSWYLALSIATETELYSANAVLP